jgi:hypothetical protein
MVDLTNWLDRLSVPVAASCSAAVSLLSASSGRVEFQ